MDRRRFGICWICSALLIIQCGLTRGRPEARAAEPAPIQGVRWQRNLQAAHRESVRLNRPILILFGAEWCHFCKKLEKETLGEPRMAQYVNQTFVPVYLDFDREERAAEILQVKSIPCTVVLTPQADLVGRLEGYAESSDFGKMLAKATALQSRVQQARFTKEATHQPGPKPRASTK